MFLSNPSVGDSEKVCIIGEFVKIEGSNVIIKSNGNYFKVLPKGLDSFKTKNTLVVGSVQNGVINEEYVQPVEDDFDFGAFQRLSKISSKFPEIL